MEKDKVYVVIDMDGDGTVNGISVFSTIEKAMENLKNDFNFALKNMSLNVIECRHDGDYAFIKWEENRTEKWEISTRIIE